MIHNSILKFSMAGALVAAMSMTVSAYELTDWQAELPDAAYVSTVSLPGAHDAATGEGFTSSLLARYSQTQTRKLVELYDAGVRVIDFRPGVKGNALKCYHGSAELTKDFGEAIKEMCQWLNAHPGEFFVIHLYKASDDNSNLDSNNLMGNLMNDPEVAPHLIQFKPDLTVGEMRGKILFMKRDGLSWNSPYATVLDRWYETDNLLSGYELRGRVYPTKPGTTNRYDRRETYLLVQDKANIRNAGDQKQREAKQIFDFLSTWRPTTRNNMVWTFNFASAYNATISTSSSYAETAESINPYFLECVNNSAGPVGMIMMDFVGADQHSGFAGASRTYTTQGATLTKAIIDQNFKYIDDLVDRQVNGVRFVDKSWSGVLWDHMFYGNNIFADVNGNGWMDYAIASSQSENGTVYFTTNNQQGGFNFMTEKVFGTNYGNHVLVPVDFNNDGKLDMLVVKGGSAELQMNLGGAQFAKLSATGISGTTSIDENNNFEGRAVVLDVNHNGRKDVVIYGNDGYPKVFLNNGDGSFAATDTNFPRIKEGTMAIGDYDLDGFADILINGKNESDEIVLSIVLTRDDLDFEVVTPESLQLYATYDGGVMFADMNMDGMPDVFVSGLRNGENRHDSYFANLLINKGGNEFERADVLLDPVKKANADWADITGNGRPDIVYAGENHLGYYTTTVINAGDGVYKAESSMDGHRASTSVAAFDYRGTGRASVAVMGHSWDSKANQMFDAEPDGAAVMNVGAQGANYEAQVRLAELVPGSDTAPGVILAVANADEIPSGYLYNYVLKLNDGSLVSNVPVNPENGLLLTADVNGATASTTVVYPTIRKADVESVGIQVIGPDKKAAPLDLTAGDITTGIDHVEVDAEAGPVYYYNMQGVRVSKPVHGIYMECRGGKTRKIKL